MGGAHIFEEKKSLIIPLKFPTHIQGIILITMMRQQLMYILDKHVCTCAFNYKCTQNLA